MPVLLPYTDNWLLIVDHVNLNWGKCTAPIYVEGVSPAGSYTLDAVLLGTGFFVTYREVVFFVTAAHLFEGLDKKRTLAANVNGKAILLSGLPFFLNKENDLAVALLPRDWLAKTGLKSINLIDLNDEKEGFESMMSWIAIGYPGSKNGIYPKLRKHAINVYGASFFEIIEKPLSKTHNLNPIAFRFDKKKAVDSSSRRVNPPCFSGMSGSPVLEIFRRFDENDNPIIGCKLKGVFLGWHKSEKEAIAARLESVLELLDEFISELAKPLD